ncbi:hypothetical protein C2857_002964 [Epichloe festucae Fl1]|uniref:Uncharacterized protein n=1 Tax=Epichloe festucae (strain Fl1) TaxID=877507 RepID=A0A7S9KUM9_EPIFF|nr:hypothetical protein C2857_002964 [Epichloe festucae Fl1]
MADCADCGPPSYEDAISHSISTPLSGTERYTLVLDGCNIYPAAPPSQFLYEISSPPRDALDSIHGVQKWRFRLSDHQGEGTIKSRLDHIYDFQDVLHLHSVNSLRPAVKVDGKAGNKRSHREVVLLGGHTGWSTCAAAEGWFKADMSMRDRFKKDGQISWRSRDGVLVAVETRARRRGEEHEHDRTAAAVLPRLEVVRGVLLKEKDLDLLVTCWVARVWKEAQVELKERMAWKDCRSVFSLVKGKTTTHTPSRSTNNLVVLR